MSRRRVSVVLEFELVGEATADELVEAIADEVPWQEGGMVHVKVGAYVTIVEVDVGEVELEP